MSNTGTAASIGVITAIAGSALLVAPDTVGRLIGLDNPSIARAIGVADLSLVPGLVAGRPRWPWVIARAALNLPMAAVCLRDAGSTSRRRNARAFATAMLTATTSDVFTARRLIAAERAH